MKKIALTSLLAVVAVSGAHAANVIDGNPLYLPGENHFYSETSMETSTRDVDTVAFGEEFGYGVTDRLAVNVGASISENDWFHETGWDSMALGLTYRIADYTNWKFDVMGGYGVGPVWDGHDGFFKGRFLAESQTRYSWVAGVRGGYTTADWTIAGHAMWVYENTESFNWGDDSFSKGEGLHTLLLGIDGQLVLNNNWNLVAGAEYSKLMDHYSEVHGDWELTFGANYNIDATKYVGAYITKDVTHSYTTKGTWDFEDGFGLGLKFGIDF